MERTQLLARELDLPAIGADVVRHSRNNRGAITLVHCEPRRGQLHLRSACGAVLNHNVLRSVHGAIPAHRPYLQLDATLVDERLDVPLGVIIASADIDVGHRAREVLELKGLDEIIFAQA